MPDQTFYEYQHIFKPSAYRNSDVAKAVKRRLDELDDVFKYGLENIAAIDQSKHLTKEGKIEAYRKTGAEVAALLKPIEKVISAYEDRIREARDAITPKPHDRADVAWQLEKQEVRTYLRTLDPAERAPFLLTAVEQGNSLIMEAVKYSPIPNEFAAQELIDKITARQIESQFPEASAAIREMERAQTEVQSAFESVRVGFARQQLNLDVDASTQAVAA